MVGWATACEFKHEALMTSHPLRVVVLGAILALAGIASDAGAAVARTIYDGSWSVLIVTRSGSCDPTYRYGVQITDGMVAYDGVALVTMQGKVTPKGVVRVMLEAGAQRADGTGRLTRNRGGGTWQGHGTRTACAGTWEAERRG